MAASEVVTARPDLTDRIHRLIVFRQSDAFGNALLHAELVHIHHEFLIGTDKTTLKPSGRMQDEIGARENG